MKQNRAAGFAVITAIYMIAIGIGILLFQAFPELPIFLRILIGDIGATVFTFLTGVILQNASVYDPYWSVAPIVIFTWITLHFGKLDTGIFLLLVAVWYWGVRLTCNWAYTFKNLATQDWRYDGFKRKYPRAFQIISFFGINLFPTLVVYLCMLPGIVFIEKSAFNVITLFGFSVCIIAATLQLFADRQIHRFRQKNAEQNLLIREGIWKYARHPNYLGEILMWWGIYVIMLSSSTQWLGLFVGPLTNTLMFLFVSIPLADKRNREKRPGFEEYIQETNNLLPFKIKRSAPIK